MAEDRPRQAQMHIKTYLAIACSLFVFISLPAWAEVGGTDTDSAEIDKRVTNVEPDVAIDTDTDVDRNDDVDRDIVEPGNAKDEDDPSSEEVGADANGDEVSEGDAGDEQKNAARETDDERETGDERETDDDAGDDDTDRDAWDEDAPPATEDGCVSQYESLRSENFTSVGTEATYYVRFKGQPLKAQTANKDDPIRVWVDDVIADCDATIYQLRYVSDLSGRFDLSRFLLGEDGLEVAKLKSAVVVVRELLPDDHDGQLEALPLPPLKPPLRYKLLLILIGTLWLVPFVWYWLKRQADRQHNHHAAA